MSTSDSFKRGWEYASQLAGADASARYGDLYVGSIEKEIKELEDNINRHNYRNLGAAQFKGYVAEEWSAGSFNVDAVASGSDLRAEAVHSTEKLSVDIRVGDKEQIELGRKIGHGVGKEFSSKIDVDGKKSAIEQRPYTGMKRLVASDQLEDARDKALFDGDYDTYVNLTDKVEKNGVKSIPAKKSDYEQMAEDGHEQRFKADKYGLTTNEAIKTEYIVKQALKAGCTVATITLLIQLTPVIISAIDYLIKYGEINLDEIHSKGIKAVSSGAESFLRGSITCSIQIACDKGLFGRSFMHIDPLLLAPVVSIAFETSKNAILVATGKMTPREMGDNFIDNVFVTTGFIAGCKLGAKIGGAFGQILGVELPIVGYLLGSLIGAAFAAGYNIGKRRLISFCVDTGFTCFGLVDQNYELPEEVLHDLGIILAQLEEAQIEEAVIEEAQLEEANLDKSELETVELKFVRRGVIGVNRVGYVV